MVRQWLGTMVGFPGHIGVRVSWNGIDKGGITTREVLLGGSQRQYTLLPQRPWRWAEEVSTAWNMNDSTSLGWHLVDWCITVLAWGWVSACYWGMYHANLSRIHHQIPFVINIPICYHKRPLMHHIPHVLSLSLLYFLL